MPDTETGPSGQPSVGLMQALAPIATRRPVHIIISASITQPGLLHVVCQPVRVLDGENGELARGYSVEASPQQLDAQLGNIMASRWVPAHTGLQQVIDEAAAAAEAARQTVIEKPKTSKGGKAGKAVPGGAQTALIPPTASDATLPLLPPAATTATTTATKASASAAAPADHQLVMGDTGAAPPPDPIRSLLD